MCSKGPLKVVCNSIHAPGEESRVIKMLVAGFFFFLAVFLFLLFGVILLITKYIRGFGFHILELVYLNYPSRGTTLQASLLPPWLIAGLWQELLERWLLHAEDRGGQ